MLQGNLWNNSFGGVKVLSHVLQMWLLKQLRHFLVEFLRPAAMDPESPFHQQGDCG